MGGEAFGNRSAGGVDGAGGAGGAGGVDGAGRVGGTVARGAEGRVAGGAGGAGGAGESVAGGAGASGAGGVGGAGESVAGGTGVRVAGGAGESAARGAGVRGVGGAGVRVAGGAEGRLDAMLAGAHAQLAVAVNDRLMGQGGVPEPRDPDLVLSRLLASAHRGVAGAVDRRLAEEARGGLDAGHALQGARAAGRGPLVSRAPAVRVKYRQEALRLVRVYWPRDLAEATRTAVRAVEDLGDLLEQAARPAEEARTAVGQLRRRLEEVAELPGPKRFPVTLTGLDYLAAVESVLARPAERLRQDARSALRLLEEELTPLLPTTGSGVDAGEAMYLYDIGTVAQDLVDDLAQVCDRADVLSRAVAEVEKASSDFVGADLRDANLDGVLLEGILWDAATVWPADWEALVRRASLPSQADGEILVVAANPCDSAVPADA